jgi:SNF2 family DNA or RNA helicase
LTRELFHYQIVGRDWLARQKTCLLADEPRLGKAVQCIAALDKLQATAALVVCRGVARSNWADEFGLWSKREWRAHCVYGRSAPIPFRGDDRPFVVVCNYENLEYLLTQLPADYKFDAAIIDESHYVKNLEAKRTRAVPLPPTDLPRNCGRYCMSLVRLNLAFGTLQKNSASWKIPATAPVSRVRAWSPDL